MDESLGSVHYLWVVVFFVGRGLGGGEIIGGGGRSLVFVFGVSF